ncbi:MAG TPA: hypothetical protein VGE85_00685 [Terracidiphilus sp.]|jgi:hypothetical protein
MTIMITKTDAAERQLNTAIRLFFENRDHLSSYALAVASREITDGVIKSRRSEIYQREFARVGDPLKVPLSYWEYLEAFIKPEFYTSFIELHNKLQNFLKHAKTDPDAEIEPLSTKLLVVVIIFAIKNYVLLTQHWTIEMATFFFWFAVAEPQGVNLPPEDVMTNKAIAEMRNYISGDPYDSDILENIYSAMTHV